ncbi:MAG: helix-hairpin-helix domain-containing protein [Xanthomonadales bacterium]|nr:helix-hairpin-helix domain-containing protein [Xanthomonadales bacterium]
MNMIKNLLASLALSVALIGSAFAADKVNINTATASEMAEVLNGVGDSKAEAIVAHRKENGPFKSADQLAEVRGIGLKTVEKNRDRIVVGATPAPAAAQPAKPTATQEG